MTATPTGRAARSAATVSPSLFTRSVRPLRRAIPLLAAALLATLPIAAPRHAAAQTEFHLQYGRLLNPFTGAANGTLVATFQSTEEWAWGDSFLFFDILADGGSDGFNEKDLYGEWYPSLSLGKVGGRRVGFGPVRDFALLAGFNYGAHAKLLRFTPGARASWDVPGFVFVNTDAALVVDASGGIAEGGAPKRSGGWVLDASWLAEWDMFGLGFSFAGHAQYGSAGEPAGGVGRRSILAQPQLRIDAGRAAGGAANRLMVGFEYQHWSNKLGTAATERAMQLLAVWRL